MWQKTFQTTCIFFLIPMSYLLADFTHFPYSYFIRITLVSLHHDASRSLFTTPPLNITSRDVTSSSPPTFPFPVHSVLPGVSPAPKSVQSPSAPGTQSLPTGRRSRGHSRFLPLHHPAKSPAFQNSGTGCRYRRTALAPAAGHTAEGRFPAGREGLCVRAWQ